MQSESVPGPGARGSAATRSVPSPTNPSRSPVATERLFDNKIDERLGRPPGVTPARYSRRVNIPFQAPLDPMLAKLTEEIPVGEGWQYEPKWDGFRALVFRDGASFYIQSRDLKPLDRYFPELAPAFAASLPERCVLDGEIVIAGPHGLDFDSLLLRIHPAASRVKLLAAQTPASFVAWDILALGDCDLRDVPQGERRRLLEKLLDDAVIIAQAGGIAGRAENAARLRDY